MSDFATWQLEPAVAGHVARLGWRADETMVRDVVPPVARGSGVVAVLPPGPVWAGPIAASLLGTLAARQGRVLILTAPALVAEWGALASTLAAGTALRIEAARGPARAARQLKADAVDVLIAAPDTALALHARSTLSPERITTVVFAWPEDWDADEALLVLLQDLPKEAQRIVLTARPERLEGKDGLLERYARKALVLGAPAADADDAPVAAVRTLATSWSGRAAAVAHLLEITDPHKVAIWTADTRDHAALTAALGGLATGISLVTREVPDGGMVICYDLPSLDQLRALTEATEVTLLVPPGTESYVARLAATRRPVPVESAATALLRRDATLRAEVARGLDRGDDAAALYALAPLFERWEPQQVAAALWRLWRTAAEAAPRSAEGPAAPPRRETTPVGGVATARVWIGAGKKDDATVADVVAVLAKEVGLDRSLIGRVDLKDTFTLVEVPAAEAERVAQKLVGLTIRRRKLSARVDTGRAGPARGPGGGGGMGGGSRGPGGGGRGPGGGGMGGGRGPSRPRS